jgi:hypothetical protein
VGAEYMVSHLEKTAKAAQGATIINRNHLGSGYDQSRVNAR